MESKAFIIRGEQICIILDPDDIKKRIGTGFLFLRKDWVVTAAHVIQDESNFKSYRKTVLAHFLNNHIYQLEIVGVHYENDIALLKIIGSVPTDFMPFYPGYDDLSQSENLIYCGYSPSKGNTITIGLSNRYSKEEFEREDFEKVFEFESIEVEPGFSGGPVLGKGGNVLGVLIELFNKENK